MPKSLAKVKKKLSKKGANISALHENSRNSQKLRRASARDDKLARVAAGRAKINKPHLQRVAYFQEAATNAEGLFDVVQIQELIKRYLERGDDEYNQLRSERRTGRPRSTREDLLKQRMDMENREYDGGFWAPDMMDLPNLEILRNWNGEWTSLNTLKYVRLSRNGTKHDSSFPPKGQS
ncbi:hypothetical protein MMC19_005801 [Ptychographa xylographoides]|nr:hypothetical protein [Ptychographa xylographoides]